MKACTAYSTKKKVKEIVKDIAQQINGADARLIQFYASPAVDPEAISLEMKKAFPAVPMIGCSTSGEIVTGKMLDQSVVVMALGDEIVEDCKIEVLTGVSQFDGQVDQAFASIGKHFKQSMHELDTGKYVGLVLIDGLCVQEERINERIGDLTNITFIGGSAGDDLAFQKTFIYANGLTYSDAAVLAVIKSKVKFAVIKTQSFCSTDKKVLITKADERSRRILEINNKPALQEYATLLGKDAGEAQKSFFSNPLGLEFENDFYVRSPQKAVGNDIVFYCAIKEGMELSVLQSTDIVPDTKWAIEQKLKELGSISAIMNFNCILRTLELKQKDQTEAYGQLFKEMPTIGFSTYGESYIGHINQTATMLVFN